MASHELTWQATAAANLLEARKKNGRLGSKKSRSGCITCKIRRLKCDETKPECNRCMSSGRICDGYVNVAVKPKSATSLIGVRLSNSIGLAEGDRRTFDYFLSWTAPRLAGSLDKEFWCGYVLQLAQTEPLVRDSLLAISTLYEHPQYMVSFYDKQEDAPNPQHEHGRLLRTDQVVLQRRISTNHINALKLYNKAIKAVKKLVDDGQATPMMSLLSCLLFICIETIRDHVFSAISLFSRGMNLMKQFEDCFADETEQRLLTLIKLMFARLGVLIAAFGHPCPLDVPPESVIAGQRTVFSNMSDARTAWYNVMADSHAYIRDANAWKESLIGKSNDEDSSDGYMHLDMFDSISNVRDIVGLRPVSDAMSETGRAILPGTFNLRTGDALSEQSDAELAQDRLSDAFERTRLHSQTVIDLNSPAIALDLDELRTREVIFQNRLGQWFDAFQWPRKQAEETEPETASNLLMYYHSSVIWLSTRLDLTQTIFDRFTFHFKEIIRHAEIYVKAKAVQEPSFTFEVGAVPPMYFTAIKCRVPSLRRRALDLLSKAPKKECMWGANSTAELACRLITIEEEGLDLPAPDCSGRCADVPIDDTILPPEAQRVHVLEIMRNRSTQSFDVRVTRYVDFGGRLVRRLQDYPI